MKPSDNGRPEREKNRSERTEKMRQFLRGKDDLDLLLEDAFFDKMHEQIMSKVAQTEMAPPEPMIKVKSYLKTHWRGLLYSGSTAAMGLGLAISLSFEMSSLLAPPEALVGLDQKSQEVVTTLAEAPEEFSRTILTNVSEDEFFVDVALQSNENLSSSQVNKIMGVN